MSDRVAEEIKDVLEIRDVLKFYGIEFNSRGFAPCPFHKEKTASFSTKGKKYKCFGCGASGDVIDFATRYFGINFGQAIIRLNADFNLNISDRPLKAREIWAASELKKINDSEREWKRQLHMNIIAMSQLHSILFRVSCQHEVEGLPEYLLDLESRIEMEGVRLGR